MPADEIDIGNIIRLFEVITGIRRRHLWQYACMSLIYGFLGQILSFLVNTIGILYPLYQSMQAVMNDNDVTFWLTYWMEFYCIQFFLGSFTGWIQALKNILIIWIMWPGELNGVSTIHNSVMIPAYQKLCDIKNALQHPVISE